MNKLEVADLIEQIPQELTPDDFLVALATKAAEVEREACAKVCDVEAEFVKSDKDGSYSTARNCAEAIRSRGKK